MTGPGENPSAAEMKNLSLGKAAAPPFAEKKAVKREAQGQDSGNQAGIVFQNLTKMKNETGVIFLSHEERNLSAIELKNLHSGKETRIQESGVSGKEARVMGIKLARTKEETKALATVAMEKEKKVLAIEERSLRLENGTSPEKEDSINDARAQQCANFHAMM